MTRALLLVLTSVLMVSLIARDTDAQVMMDMVVETPEPEVRAVDRIDNIMGGGTNVNRTTDRTVIAGPDGVLRVDRNRTRVGDGDRGAGVVRDSVVGVSRDGTLRADRDRVVVGDRDRGVGVIGSDGTVIRDRDGTVRVTDSSGAVIGDRDRGVVGVDRDRTVVRDGDRGAGVVRDSVVGVSRDGTLRTDRDRVVVGDRDRGVGVIGSDGTVIRDRDGTVRVTDRSGAVIGDRDRGVVGVDRNRTVVRDGDRGAGVVRDSVVGVSREGTLRADRDRVVVGDRDRGVGVIGSDGTVRRDRDGTVRVTDSSGVLIGDRDRGVVGVDRDRTVVGDRDRGVVGVERDRAVGIGRDGAVVVGRNRTVVGDRDRGVGVVTSERRVGLGTDGRIRLDRDRSMIGRLDNFTGAGDFILDGVSTLTVAQRELNTRCAALCKTEVCYLSDVDDCRNFITCQQDALGRYHATLQPCAFGTYWAGLQLQKKITCDLPSNVVCNIDYCAGRPSGSMYDHTDGNCKTYWECDYYGKPQPRCCPDGYRFDNSKEQCVEDRLRRCHDRCPIKIDACRIPGTTTEYFDDGNCRTYWDCEDLNPHPVCCPEGQGYDVIEGCVPRRLCNDTCPPQYTRDICLQPGVERYSLIDGSCRTYMKCNPIDGDERWCCPSNYVFDSASQLCIERTADMDLLCDDNCPMFYYEECHLKAVPDRPDHYYMNIHGAEMERPCAPGTLFDINKCGCATVIRNTPDNSCSKELDIVFDHPMWHRSGSQSQVEIITVGTLDEGPKLNGRTSFRFNGDLYFRTPFFQSQYDNLYIKLVFLPETMTTGKQVLLSNCMNLDLGAPSMELSLQNDRLVLDLVTDNIYPNATFTQNRPVSVSVPYTPGIWNTFTAIYNGRQVYLLNEGQGAPTFANHTLTGPISVAAEGLDFGGCYINRGSGEGYVGSLAQLEFSKCLKQSWLDTFSTSWPTRRDTEIVSTL